ncbi:MAG: hypothetical protein ACJ0FI_02210 [Gammaproteobacteria bacterium]
MNIFNKYLVLLLVIISVDSSAQNYLPEETPLNVKICDFVDINGSVDQTSLIALVPKLTLKSGTLSACGINQAVGDISGNTKSGITRMGSGEPEYIRKHCEEIACRAQHANLINERAREVVKLLKSNLKISNNNSGIKKIERIAGQYEKFHILYSNTGSSFSKAEEYVSERLETLIVEQFERLPQLTQEKWKRENNEKRKIRIEQEQLEADIARAKAEKARAAARARAKAKSEREAAERAKAKAEKEAREKAQLEAGLRIAAAKKVKTEKTKQEWANRGRNFGSIFFIFVIYVIFQTLVKRYEKKPIPEPKPIIYAIFTILFIGYPTILHPFSSLYWLIPLAAVSIAVSYLGLDVHGNFYAEDLLEEEKRAEALERKRKAAELAEREKKEREAREKRKAQEAAEEEERARKRRKLNAEIKITTRTDEIIGIEKTIKDNQLKVEDLDTIILTSEAEVKRLKEEITDEKDRFSLLMQKYSFLSKGKIIKNR